MLPETARQLLEKMQSLMTAGKITEKSRIVFVNDGSKDRTWELIQKFHAENPIYQGISLSRNRGHQNALLAGLMTVKKHCDMTISLDADLQDDIDAIDQMIAKYEAGNDIVYGVRSARKTDTLFKKCTAEGFYKVMKHMGADLVFNHADYRLMSRRALDGLESLAQNENGEEIIITGENELAQCFCHEIEHLDGEIFLDKAIAEIELNKT